MGAQDQMPRGEDDLLKRVAALEKLYQVIVGLAGSAAALAQAIQTGLGNLATSGTTWDGPVNSPSTVTAAGALSGATLNVSGAVKMPTVYSTSITSAFRVVYNGNGDGSMGYNLSSRRFNQDIESYTIDPTLLRQIRIVTFRYIAAVEKEGNAATVEVGLIAEELHDLGLNWLVDYDADGLPEGVKFDRLALAALALAQDVDTRLALVEERIGL